MLKNCAHKQTALSVASKQQLFSRAKKKEKTQMPVVFKATQNVCEGGKKEGCC